MRIAIASKHVVYVALGTFTALLVTALLLYSNFGVINVLSHFGGPDQYQEKLVLFYGDGCDQCDKVNDYLVASKVQKKISFEKLEVLNSKDNRNILSDKAQICGIGQDQIGVPLLWDGPQQRCVIGYLDIINYFKTRLKLLPKG